MTDAPQDALAGLLDAVDDLLGAETVVEFDAFQRRLRALAAALRKALG